MLSLDVELESTQDRLVLSERSIDLLDSELQELIAARERGAAVQIEVDRLRRQRTTLELERETLRQILASIPSRRSALESRAAAQSAELSLAELDLARASVRAPISGVLSNVYVDQGDRVSPGTAIARIVDLRTIEVPLRIPAAAARVISPGDVARVSEPVGDGRVYEGVVVRIAPEIDPQSRTLTVFIEVEQEVAIDSPDATRDLLLPGQFVSGEIVSRVATRSIVLPRLAINGDRVMVIDEQTGTAQPRHARVAYFTDARFPQIDRDETQWAVIRTSNASDAPWQAPQLATGERVIVSNLDELPAGTPVQTRDAVGRNGEAGS
jgi:RND family efflux transporter MFP subunit